MWESKCRLPSSDPIRHWWEVKDLQINAEKVAHCSPERIKVQRNHSCNFTLLHNQGAILGTLSLPFLRLSISIAADWKTLSLGLFFFPCTSPAGGKKLARQVTSESMPPPWLTAVHLRILSPFPPRPRESEGGTGWACVAG